MIRYQPTRISLDMTTVQQAIAKLPPRRSKQATNPLSSIRSPSLSSNEQSSPSVTPKSTLKGKTVISHVRGGHDERDLLGQEDGARDSSEDHRIDDRRVCHLDPVLGSSSKSTSSRCGEVQPQIPDVTQSREMVTINKSP
jgi:hypothetical protein